MNQRHSSPLNDRGFSSNSSCYSLRKSEEAKQLQITRPPIVPLAQDASPEFSMPFMKAGESPPPSSLEYPPSEIPSDPDPNPEKLNLNSTAAAQTGGSLVPVVRLDVDAVSDVLAAGSVAVSVGHVLFLKTQVPLYVAMVFFPLIMTILTRCCFRPVRMQLARMAGKVRVFFFPP